MTAFIEYEKNGDHAHGRGRVFVGSGSVTTPKIGGSLTSRRSLVGRSSLGRIWAFPDQNGGSRVLASSFTVGQEQLREAPEI
jgi:hypothetical protein